MIDDRYLQRLKCKGCTMGGTECMLTERPHGPCGWEKMERIRRNGLPLVYDRRTGTRRRYIGRPHDTHSI